MSDVNAKLVLDELEAVAEKRFGAKIEFKSSYVGWGNRAQGWVRIADDWHLLSFAVKDDKLRRFIDGALVDDKEGIMDDHDGKDLNDDQDDELEESDPRRLNEEVTIAKEGRDAAEDRRDA